MSLRSKTLKAEKYGTPVTPVITTPKEPSPKEPQIIKTIPQVVVTATKVSSKTHPRTAISFGVTPTQEGIKAQQSFTAKLYSVTVPIKNEIDELKTQLVYYTKDYLSDPTRSGQTTDWRTLKLNDLTNQIHNKENEIDTIVEDIINVELQANVNQIIQAIESASVGLDVVSRLVLCGFVLGLKIPPSKPPPKIAFPSWRALALCGKIFAGIIA